jgi:hypothetical protein
MARLEESLTDYTGSVIGPCSDFVVQLESFLFT